MQIRTIQKGFIAFEGKFEPFKGIQRIWMQIRTIRKGFEAFECKFEPLERDSKYSNSNANIWDHSKGFRSILIQISNHSKGIQSIRMQIRTIWKE